MKKDYYKKSRQKQIDLKLNPRICLICNKTFYVENQRKNTAKYCSKKCQLSARGKKGGSSKGGKKCKPHTEQTKIKIGLANKGRKFTKEQSAYLSMIRKGKKQSEATKLKRSIALKKAYSEGRKNANHLKGRWSEEKRIQKSIATQGQNYKNGNTGIYEAIRKNVKTRIWRESVFKRDDYTCQFCGARSGNGKKIVLNADHIIPFCKIIEQIKFQYGVSDILKKADESKLLWDINNGRTLCEDCHRQTDTFAGRAKKLLKQ